MKILLLNDNPVVNKLVTLSAQKTSDEVDITSNIDGIKSHKYDLLIVDDSVYSDELLGELEEKVKYQKSLFICAKDMDEIDSFSSVLKKPFLPTDLVELFMMFEKDVANEVDDEVVESHENVEVSENEIIGLDELDDELTLEDEADTFGESILDDEEAQKVKDLLNENEEELSFDEEVQNDIDSLELDEEDELNLEEDILDSETEDLLADYDMALDLEDEADVDISDDEDFDLTDKELDDEADVDIPDDIMDEFDLEDKMEDEELEEFEDIEDESKEKNLDLESEIQNAVENLSQEDLESELDEETLLKIAANEIDPLADLTSKDLKVALGEEVEPDIEDVDTQAVAELEDDMGSEEINEADGSGVEALKKLLEALNDKNVAAAMKGMKISINITLGDN